MSETWLFDLDGTLVDTAPDLIAALNQMRRARNLDEIPVSELRHEASNGARGLLRAGLDLDSEAPEFPAAREEFLRNYAACLSEQSSLFPGIADLLHALDAGGHQWGIVTNKPISYARPLVHALGLRPAVLLGGDSASRPKPAPDSLWLAAAHLATASARCLYLGDAARDIEAGHHAGMRTVACGWGYIAADDDPARWGATHHFDAVDGLRTLLS